MLFIKIHYYSPFLSMESVEVEDIVFNSSIPKFAILV